MRSVRLAASLALLGSVAHAAPPKGPPPAPVRVAEVVKEQAREGHTFVGNIVPTRAARLATGVEGFLETFGAREGQRLAAQHVVAELKQDHIGPQLAAARATLEALGHEITELTNGTRKEVLAEARARVAEAEVAVSSAKRRLATAERLREGKHVSAEEVLDAADAVRAAEATLIRVRASHALLQAGTRKEQIDQARAREKRQQAEVDRLEALAARHTIRAPFAGYVMSEHAEEGTWLARGAPLVSIEALDHVRARFPVLEDFIGGVKPGDAVAVQITALPDRVFEATIERVVPMADAQTRTVPVDVKIKNVIQKNGSPLIKSGMFARTVLAVGPARDALLVPLDALVLGGPSPMVFVVGKDGKAQPRPVQLGAIIKGRAVIQGPVQAGERVVIEGNERLRPGVSVRVLDR